MDGAVVPPSWSFDPKRPSTGLCRLLGGARPWHQHGDSSPQTFSGASATNVLIPRVSHGQPPRPAQETCRTHRLLRPGRRGPSTRETLCALQKRSPSPQSARLPRSGHAGLQSLLDGVPPATPEPQAGARDVGLGTPVEEVL